MIPKNIRNVNF